MSDSAIRLVGIPKTYSATTTAQLLATPSHQSTGGSVLIITNLGGAVLYMKTNALAAGDVTNVGADRSYAVLPYTSHEIVDVGANIAVILAVGSAPGDVQFHRAERT